jgi:uncharacterized protein (UPF0332 family)
MPELLNKSELNLNAAEYLFKKGHYATVCHPAYYSCLQLIKYKIKKNLKIDYPQQSSETSASYNGNTHVYLISKVKSEIKRKRGIEEAKIFDREIKDLKELREKADYQNISICFSDCDRAIKKAKELILTIKNVL